MCCTASSARMDGIGAEQLTVKELLARLSERRGERGHHGH